MKNLDFKTGMHRVIICLSALYAFAFFLFFYHATEHNWNFHGSFTADSGLNLCYETVVESFYFPKMLYGWVIIVLQCIAKLIPLTSTPPLFLVSMLFSGAVFASTSLFLSLLLRAGYAAFNWIATGFTQSRTTTKEIDTSA